MLSVSSEHLHPGTPATWRVEIWRGPLMFFMMFSLFSHYVSKDDYNFRERLTVPYVYIGYLKRYFCLLAVPVWCECGWVWECETTQDLTPPLGDSGPYSGKRLSSTYLKFRQQSYSPSHCSGVSNVHHYITSSLHGTVYVTFFSYIWFVYWNILV